MTLIFGDNLYYNLLIMIAVSIIFTWFVTQGFKVFLKCWIGKKFSFKMFVADGDFPSTHTAVVTSSVILVLYLNYFALKCTDADMIAAVSCAKDFLIMITLASIVIRDAMGQRHRQDNTNNNVKKLKDYVKEVVYELSDGDFKDGIKNIEERRRFVNSKKYVMDFDSDKNVVDQIDATFNTLFKSIDKEALKRVGHLKHEVYGGLVTGTLSALYPIIFFFGENIWLKPTVIVSVIFFLGITIFLKLKPVIIRQMRYRKRKGLPESKSK